MRTALLMLAALVLFDLYQISLVYGIALPLGMIDPPWWDRMFSSLGTAVQVWMAIHHTIAVVLVSIPFACVLRMLYGRHALTVAFAISGATVLIHARVAFALFAHGPMRHQILTIIDQLKLIGTLPFLTWAAGKLPSNSRIGRRMTGKLPGANLSARRAPVER